MTARYMRWIVATIGLLTVVDHQEVPGQQARDLARVSGVVLTAEDQPRPVRRAIVSIRGSDLALGHHAITDDVGRFEIGDLPAGRYDLSARRPSFVTIEYGASRPEWPGTQLALSPGQHVAGITLRLAPGAVITGTVRDETGEAMVDLEVWIQRRTPSSGLFERFVNTDPQGVYRFYGLPPGPYIVWAKPLATSTTLNYAASDTDVDAILRQLSQGRPGSPQPLSVVPPVVQTSVPDFAPIYYPSTTNREDTIPVVLSTGLERTGVDLTVRRISNARLAGRVVGSDGRAVGSGGVELVRASRYATRPSAANLRPDGTFAFSAVSPGRYQLVTWHVSTPPKESCEFAAANLDVMSSGTPEVTLILKPCLKIAGHVEMAAGSTPTATLASLVGAVIRFEPDRSNGDPMTAEVPSVATVGIDGSFTLGGARQLVPGPYVLKASAPGAAGGLGWWLQSAHTADGRDILDEPMILADSSPETTAVVLTFTDSHTSLSGQLMTSSGRAAVDYTIVAFTANREWWRPPFRRVRSARPATDGAFMFHDLPPGEYRVVALADVAPNEWFDPDFLEQVRGQSVAVTIGAGEHKVQSLQIRGGGGVPERKQRPCD